jgi:hypothetical protein
MLSRGVNFLANRAVLHNRHGRKHFLTAGADTSRVRVEHLVVCARRLYEFIHDHNRRWHNMNMHRSSSKRVVSHIIVVLYWLGFHFFLHLR